MNRFFFLCFLIGAALGLRAQPMHWPTPHPAPRHEADFTAWVQPTQSGNPLSGMFGCVRNDGTRFHEAIDIAPFEPRDAGEATDPVFAAWDGTVEYVNEEAGTSGYGRYLVVRHDQFDPAFVTLYSHLADIAEGISAGRRVRAGDTLGRMGRSAGGYVIPPERAHLHFEIALRLTDDFQRWYDEQDFGSENDHGIWNGMNLIGLDPWEAWNWMRAVPGRTIPDYLGTLPTAYVVEVRTPRVPDIVRRYPALLTAPVPDHGLVGWRMAVTGWGMPLSFTPVTQAREQRPAGAARVVALDPEQLGAWECRRQVNFNNGLAELAVRGRRLVQLVFGFLPPE